MGKGCPFACTYCFNSYLIKLYNGQRWVRKRSIKNVIEELKIAKENCKRRGDSNKIIQIAINNLRDVGINSQIDHIFELPTETPEEYQKGLNFYTDLKPDQIEAFTLQYYPNTEIIEIEKNMEQLMMKRLNKLLKEINIQI